MILRGPEAAVRKTRFLLYRYVVIFSCGLLGYAESAESYEMGVIIMVMLGLVSNLYMHMLDPFSFFDNGTQSLILVTDTVLSFMILLVSGIDRTVAVCFFAVLMMASFINKLPVLTAVAAVLGVATMLHAGVVGGGLSPAVILRVPFLVSTAVYYGFVVLPEHERAAQAGKRRPSGSEHS